MTQTVNARFVTRHGTAAQWTASNEVLLANEIGHESDTNKMKFGDGVTTWNSLPYFGRVPAGGIAGQVLTKASALDGDVIWNTPSAGAGGQGHLAGPGLVLNVLTNIIRLAVAGDVQIAGTSVTVPHTGTGSVQLQVTGGQPPYSWTSVALPTGITLATDGTLSYDGTQADGTTSVAFTVTDAAANTSTKTLDVVVKAPNIRRFWRLKITANNGNSQYVTALEIEMAATAAGANLCAGGTAFATSSANSLNAPALAFDGDKSVNGAKWASLSAPSPSSPQCIGYVLGTASAVQEIRLWGCITSQETFAPKDFVVQSSADSTTGLDGTWDDEWSVTGQTGWAAGEVRTFTRP